MSPSKALYVHDSFLPSIVLPISSVAKAGFANAGIRLISNKLILLKALTANILLRITFKESEIQNSLCPESPIYSPGGFFYSTTIAPVVGSIILPPPGLFHTK